MSSYLYKENDESGIYFKIIQDWERRGYRRNEISHELKLSHGYKEVHYTSLPNFTDVLKFAKVTFFFLFFEGDHPHKNSDFVFFWKNGNTW